MRFLTPAILVASVASSLALKINIPTVREAGKQANITWTSDYKDPATWTLFLMNTSYIWGLKEIIAQSLDPKTGFLLHTWGEGLEESDVYALSARIHDNVDWIIYQTPAFTITNTN